MVKKGRQDRDGIHEAWLMTDFSTRTPPTPSHNPYIIAWCATLLGAKSKHSFTVPLLLLVTFLFLHCRIPFN